MTIYTDNGAERGLRTRYFRDCPGGVEWIYAADYAAVYNRWYGYLVVQANSIAKLIANGMDLTPLEEESDETF